MRSNTETTGALEIVDSMNTIEFDVDEGIYRASYNDNRDTTSLAVVAVIAAAANRDSRELAPLNSAIDTAALDSLFSTTTTRGERSGCISFQYEGFEVTVWGEGTIEADPMENT